MHDFRTGRRKSLDLVICTPGTRGVGSSVGHDLASLARAWDIRLSPAENELMTATGKLHEGPVGSVQVALEAKACMTSHSKAVPRLHDELDSSHLTVHGSADVVIAAGFVMINVAPEFISPGLNPHDISVQPPTYSHHTQPDDARKVVRKVEQLRRRSSDGEPGFDALGIVVVDCRNDGSVVTLHEAEPAPALNHPLHYDTMVRRIAQAYEVKFRSI